MVSCAPSCAVSFMSGKKRSFASDAPPSETHDTGDELEGPMPNAADAIDRLEIPFNSLGVDPYGISKAQLRLALGVFEVFYRHYFSVRTRGINHVPSRGRAMLVGNHSGGIAIDAAMVVVSCLLEMDPP